MNLLKTIPRRWMKTGLAAVLIVTAAFFYISGRTEAVVHTTADVILAEDLASAEGETAAESFVSEERQTAAESFVSTEREIAAENFVSAEQSTEATVWVHICGEVKHPGVYELPQNSRLMTGVEMAGGFTENASEEAVNLAQVVSDGQQIRIPSIEEYEEMKETAGGNLQETGWNPQESCGNSMTVGGNSAADSSGLININLADKQQLMSLPGIGETRAEAIVAYRETHGSFGTPADVMKVSGIKQAAFEKIKDKITV